MDPTGIVNECLGKLFGCVESALGRQVGYVIHYKTNLQNLQKEVDDLRATTDTVRQKITVAEAKGESIHENVKNWLEKVAEITEKLKTEEILEVEEANGSLKEKGQPKKSLQLLVEVTKLINKGRELSDISFLPPKDLQTEVDRLKVAEATVEQRVTAAKAKGEKILAEVEDWQIKVADVTKEAEEFLNDKQLSTDEAREVSGDEIQASEESNESSSHRSKKSLELVKRVTELYGLRQFSDISYSVRTEDICLQPDEDFEKFESRTSTFNNIMNELECCNSSNLILVYGIGGVGKTRFAEEVLRQAKQKKFDDTVMVRDVKIPDFEAIQNQIAEKLGMNISEIKTEPARADKINDRIKGKKTLVILDDVWGQIDLKAVGLPRIPICKILLTSRKKEVFSLSFKQKDFQLGVLDEKEAWILFQKYAGHVATDPSIQKVATEVANKCGGLPVLLITFAKALEKKALAIWKDALKCLEERFDEREDLTQKAFLGIEWSYSQLSDKEQWLFLLCGITLQGNYISLTNLLKYSIGIGIGFFRGYKVQHIRNALEALVDKLKSSCLLLDADDNTCVRMHDLVHDAAKRIAFRDKHVLVFRDKLEDGGTELKEWPDECFFSECTNIILPCHYIPALSEVSWKCPKLQMLLLHGKDEDDLSLLKVPSNFFDEMKELKVLGLHNLRLLQLPSSLLFLKKLQTLCLDGCKLEDIALVGELKTLEVLSLVSSEVEQLPEKLGELTHLRYLDLSDCRELQVIPSKVISNLTRLEELRMRNSFHKWNQASNASLSELMNLSKLTVLEIHVLDASLPSDLFSDKLEKYHIFVGDAWDCYDMNETTINTLRLQLSELNQGLKMLLERCKVLFLNGKSGVDFADIIDTKVVMSNLTILHVHRCDRLKYLLSSSMARSLVELKHLRVSDCEMIVEIISRECKEEDTDTIFYKLQILRLENLTNLATFSRTQSIEFPLLENLYITRCTKLGAFTGGPVTRNSTISEDMRKNDSEDVQSETDRQHSLFDDKVRFPKLESLKIDRTHKLQSLWHNQLAPGSFCRLKNVYLFSCSSLRSIFPPSMMERLSALETLRIHSCESVEVVFDECGETNVREKHATSTSYQLDDGQNLNLVDIRNCASLRNIFPAWLAARGLQQLQDLQVRLCPKMENIVSREENRLEFATHTKFVFPKVTFVKIFEMDTLKSFYPGLHTSEWPLLKDLVVARCKNVEVFGAELSIFQEEQLHASTKQPLFLIRKDSFPNLEALTLGTTNIFYAPSPPGSIFSKLKSISFERCAPFSSAVPFLQKLHNVEYLKLRWSDSETMFEDERNSSEEIHACIGSLPHVRRLKLYRNDKMLHLGKDKRSQPIFPKLEFLRVKFCDGLKNIESSAISFQYLTTLKICGCHGLECLTLCLIAKSLVQLTKMEVLECKRIVVIVANRPDDAENQVAFNRLQHLRLWGLPSLQGFCSDCIVKLPASITLDVRGCPIKLTISPDGIPIAEKAEDEAQDETKAKENTTEELAEPLEICVTL